MHKSLNVEGNFVPIWRDNSRCYLLYQFDKSYEASNAEDGNFAIATEEVDVDTILATAQLKSNIKVRLVGEIEYEHQIRSLHQEYQISRYIKLIKVVS